MDYRRYFKKAEKQKDRDKKRSEKKAEKEKKKAEKQKEKEEKRNKGKTEEEIKKEQEKKAKKEAEKEKKKTEREAKKEERDKERAAKKEKKEADKEKKKAEREESREKKKEERNKERAAKKEKKKDKSSENEDGIEIVDAPNPNETVKETPEKPSLGDKIKEAGQSIKSAVSEKAQEFAGKVKGLFGEKEQGDPVVENPESDGWVDKGYVSDPPAREATDPTHGYNQDNITPAPKFAETTEGVRYNPAKGKAPVDWVTAKDPSGNIEFYAVYEDNVVDFDRPWSREIDPDGIVREESSNGEYVFVNGEMVPGDLTTGQPHDSRAPENNGPEMGDNN